MNWCKLYDRIKKIVKFKRERVYIDNPNSQAAFLYQYIILNNLEKLKGCTNNEGFNTVWPTSL